MLAYEDEALDQAVDSLNAMDPAHVTAPENAHLSDYIKEKAILLFLRQKETS